MNVRDRLAEIEQRADRMTTPDPTGQRTYQLVVGRIAPDTYLTDADRAAGNYDPIRHIAADLRSLVAALRAVLDIAEHDQTSTRYIRAITEALGGGA